MNYLAYFLDIVFPKKCYICDAPNFYLCPECQKKISYHSDDPNNRVLYHYQPIKKLIHDAKFYGKKDIFREIGRYMWEYLDTHISQKHKTLLVPVPLHFFKKMKRGYNQSSLLAQEISRITGIPVLTQLIYRKKHTRQQSHFSRQQRIKNIQNCFQINKKQADKLDNYHIILIDDVVSTGSTLREIKRQFSLNYSNITITTLCIASD